MNYQLFTDAVREADRVRMELELSIFEPLNIYYVCAKLDVTVRFVDINMEGMYVSQESGNHPSILLSNQRPFARRCFTCAHELGHHRFGHGTRVDIQANEERQKATCDEEELLVDSFAGALLMPLSGIQAEFAYRNQDPENASPLQFIIIASIFGVGYQTLITHCRINKLISVAKEKALLKFSPGKILSQITGGKMSPTHYKMLDECSKVSLIDLEVSNLLILPRNYLVEGDNLKKSMGTEMGNVFLALRPGIVRIYGPETSQGHFVRIQNENYVGLAENRHLENRNL